MMQTQSLDHGPIFAAPGASSASVVRRLLASITMDGRVADVRIGTHWTVVVVETSAGPRAGLAATQIVHDLEHGRPAVRDAGKLIGRDAHALAELALSDSLTERSLGFAAINALLEVDEAQCVDLNAEETILARGRGRQVAIVGHFPFVPKVRGVAATCWVLELNPGPDDLPASMAPELIPQADVVAITGMTLVNGTFDGLIALCRPDAWVVVLGPSTPLSPLLFDYGVHAISGTVVTDIPAVVTAVSQGATFRQIAGRRLLTMAREALAAPEGAGR
ncbi:MAG: Rossmann-like domain-containing protein [Anaerolineae bacterium]